jgi:uncharacterized DUF497 family protein
MEIFWDVEKNNILKESRGISFEQVVVSMETDGIVGLFEHPNKSRYPNQIIILVNINDYIYAVPSVMDNDKIFLKTVYPSRKYTGIYLKK